MRNLYTKGEKRGMALTKSDFERLDSRIKSITEQAVEQIDVNADVPPTIEQLEDNNKTYSIRAAILFIDIRKSTHLTENSQAKSMVKIYRSFMRMAVECVRKSGGVTRQFLGDRIMGVFIDSVNEKNEVISKAVDKAIEAARSLQTVIDFSLNKHLKTNVNGKMIECGIGIDYGKVLVTQVGMYGVEKDENKEDEVDCVWVGNTTNHASKYSDIAAGGEIFISENVYKNLSENYKEVWENVAKYKGTKLFQGYVTTEYYLDYSEELGSPVKIEEENTVELDTSSQLADGIKEIERLQEKLIQRERELAVLEEQLKKENKEFKTKYINENTAKINAQEAVEKIKEDIDIIVDKSFTFVEDILGGSFCYNFEYIRQIGLERWKRIEQFFETMVVKKGLSESSITAYSFKFIEVFACFGEFSKAYEYMVAMAKWNYTWVHINEKTFRWACDNNQGWQVINAMEDNLKKNRVSYGNIKNYEEYISRLKKIRGF